MQTREPIELHGAKTGNCIRVAMALEEAGIPYRIAWMDLAANEHSQIEFLRLNPAGRVPTIVDHSYSDGPFVLSQSNAILHYVASLAPGRLWPEDGAREIALAHERFLYFVTDVIAPTHAAFVLRNDDGKGRALLARRSAESLMGAERFVESSPFMAGSAFTLADIAAVTIAYASRDELEWDRVPYLKRWYERVMSRPGVQCGFDAFELPKGVW